MNIETTGLSEAIADEIMLQYGMGHADRLVLEKDGEPLGGLIRSSVVSRIEHVLSKVSLRIETRE